ncbi:MAG: multidrug transporter [Kiritimatiellae bacterium]|nr:multidrug transporter [Kiritimatiellia bacterium]
MKSNDLVLEKDWKLFRKRLPEWQERHMQSLLDEYAAIIAGDGDAAAKFWELKERLKKDVRHVGVQAEMSRSRMVLNLMCLLHEKAITMSDLDGFSDEVKAAMPPSFTVD